MTKEDLQTELYERIANLPSGRAKEAMEAIFCIGVAFENIRKRSFQRGEGCTITIFIESGFLMDEFIETT
jgi:hypothetical protein